MGKRNRHSELCKDIHDTISLIELFEGTPYGSDLEKKLYDLMEELENFNK